MLQRKIKPDKGVYSNSISILQRMITEGLWQFEQLWGGDNESLTRILFQVELKTHGGEADSMVLTSLWTLIAQLSCFPSSDFAFLKMK